MAQNTRVFLGLVAALAVCAGFVILFGHYGFFWGIAMLVMTAFAVFMVRYTHRESSRPDQTTYVEEYRRRSREAVPSADQPTIAANAAQHTEAQTSMRSSALRKFYSIVSDLMWILTLAAFAVLMGLVPQLGVQPVPFFGTVTLMIIYLSPAALLLLVGTNNRAGRWPAPEHYARNIFVSMFSFCMLAVIGVVVFAVNKGVTGLPTVMIQLPGLANPTPFDIDLLAKFMLGATMLYALYDWRRTKSKEYLASSSSNEAYAALERRNAELENQVAALQAQLAGRAAPSRVAAPASAGDMATPVPEGVVHQHFVREFTTVVHPTYYARRRGDMPPELQPTARDVTPPQTVLQQLAVSGSVDVRHHGSVQVAPSGQERQVAAAATPATEEAAAPQAA